MKRRIISLLLIVFLLIPSMVFANGTKESSTIPTDEPIELVYWSHYGQSPAFVQAFADSVNIAAKNLGYENVTCRAEVIDYNGYETKYLTGFASDNGPDFFLGAVEHWAMDGGINPIALPLSEEAAAAWDESLGAAFVNEGVFDGVRYGFPAEGGSLIFLYINTDAMIEAGYDPETDIPTTLDEMYDMAVAMTKRDASGKVVRAGFQPRYLGGNNVWGKFTPYFHNFGARALSEDLSTASGYVNSEAAVEAVSWYQSLVMNTSNLEFSDPETAFQSGQAAMISREGWFAQDVIDKAPNINFICVPFPAGKLNLASTQGGSAWSNMISAKTKYPELCQEIMAELAKPEYDVTLHEPAMYPPVCKATMSMDNEYFSKLPYAEAMLTATNLPSAPSYSANTSWTSVATIFGDTLASIMDGADVKSSLDNAAAQADLVLAQNK